MQVVETQTIPNKVNTIIINSSCDVLCSQPNNNYGTVVMTYSHTNGSFESYNGSLFIFRSVTLHGQCIVLYIVGLHAVPHAVISNCTQEVTSNCVAK